MLGCAGQLSVWLFAFCKHDLTVLVQIAACWKDHCEQMLTIRSTFLYLDRTYVISTSGTRSLFEMGLQLYGQHLQEHPEVSLQHLSLAVHVMASLDTPNTGAHVISISRTDLLCKTGLHLHGQHLQEHSEVLLHQSWSGMQGLSASEQIPNMLHNEKGDIKECTASQQKHS